MTTEDHAGHELLSLRLAQDMSGGATFVVDPDLVITSASGPDLVGAGYDPAALAGRRLDEVLDTDRSSLLFGAYRSALRGQMACVEFVDEVGGRVFRVEVRPLRDASGEVVGAVARACDLSEVRAQATHLSHLTSAHGLGVTTYDLRSGWVHDPHALILLGIDDPGLDPARVVDEVVLPQDRHRTRAALLSALARGGRLVTSYRVAGSGPEPVARRIQSTVEVDLGTGGRLLRAVATHVDVTATFTASAAVDRAEQRLQADRIGLVRDLSSVVAHSSLPVAQIVKIVTDLIVAALGGSAAFGELSPDRSHFARFATSHADQGAAAALHALWTDPLTRPGPDDAVLRRVIGGGESWVGADPGVPDGDHRVVVPVRTHQEVVGVLALQRSGSDPAFRPDDLDLVMIAADHVGAALVTEQAVSGQRRERARREAAGLLLDDARRQRHSLVELLSETESRERMLLAEAVHDEPIQLIAAARLRLMALGRRLSGDPGADPTTVVETVRAETDRVAGILETAMERLRVLIVALTPPDLSDGLLHAVGDVAEATFRGTGTIVHCTGPDTLPLAPAQAEAAMRILREALINVRQHAQAQRVTVRAGVEPQHVVITIEDDGVGSSDIVPRKGHLGLVSMRARAADAGARLTISSSPGAGTSVELRYGLPT